MSAADDVRIIRDAIDQFPTQTTVTIDKRVLADLLDAYEAIPDTLRTWYDGRQVLAEEHGLSRIGMLWRVVEIIGHLSAGEPWEHLVKREWREFKTHAAAKRLNDQWAREGRVVLMQHAPYVWLNPNEEAAVDRRRALAAAEAAASTPPPSPPAITS